MAAGLGTASSFLSVTEVLSPESDCPGSQVGRGRAGAEVGAIQSGCACPTALPC